jgi:hypothetical protein
MCVSVYVSMYYFTCMHVCIPVHVCMCLQESCLCSVCPDVYVYVHMCECVHACICLRRERKRSAHDTQVLSHDKSLKHAYQTDRQTDK